jgi:hypothetical protein
MTVRDIILAHLRQVGATITMLSVVLTIWSKVL